MVDGRDELEAAAQDAAERLQAVDQPLRIVAHYDCDGICSAVVAHKALDRIDADFDVTFVDELNEAILKQLREDHDEDVYFFIDIGSGQIDAIEQVLDDKEVLIADHHEPGEGDVAHHVNPHNVGIDGGEKVSGAGVTYLIAEAMDADNTDLIKYALVGATGDIQKDGDTYLGMNERFVEDAEDLGLVTRKKGLKLYGRSRKSIVDALQYTTQPFLPGISNSQSGALQFLSEIGIDPRDDGDWRTLEDLSEAEEQQIIHGLITRGYDVDELLGDVYILDNGWEIGEFSSLMNACGRMERPEDGLKICIEADFGLAKTVKRSYGRKIGKYLSYVEDNCENNDVVQEFEHGGLIVADDNIHANMIGTITTICQKSNILEHDILVGMAYKDPAHIKISARAKDPVVEDGFTMNAFMEHVCAACNGEGGGHDEAAGGKIPRDQADRFIKLTGEVLTERALDALDTDKTVENEAEL